MTRSDLIAKISEIYPYMNIRNIDKIIQIIVGKIVDAMIEGRRVELRGFGSFSIKHRQEAERRNPRTGEKVIVKSKYVPYFKAGKQLKDLVNGAVTVDE
jgi:integration host factor subunit beta